MKVAVLSDIHDHVLNLDKTIKQIKANTNVKAVIFCGDMVAPFTARILFATGLPTYLCLGNNDEDHIGLYKQSQGNFTWFHLSQEFGTVELSGRKIAFCHYPRLAELLTKSGEYDAVFHGHTHMARNETRGKTTLINPGPVCGITAGKLAPASYALYDTNTNLGEIVPL